MAGTRRAALLTLVVLLAAGCGASGSQESTAPAPTSGGPVTPAAGAHSPAHHPTAAPATAPLRAGERAVGLGIPGGSYRPSAAGEGRDDYRCFLLDPKLVSPAFLTGVRFAPGNPALVHHAILYRVEPGAVASAERADAESSGPGWRCFGGTGLDGDGTIAGLNTAPWLSAWAPGAGEQVFGAGVGVRMAAGTRIALQVHYNLHGAQGGASRVDSSTVRLRFAPGSAALRPLYTMLLPAPVELPCPPEERGPLCDRGAALLDIVNRFGAPSGQTVHGLQLLCGGDFERPRAGASQSCDRPNPQQGTIYAVAGHMHLLGKSIRIELNPGTPRARTLLDRAVWDFDDQRATVLPTPVKVRKGDVLRVSCTHDVGLRRRVAELRSEVPRYVVWGEGTADEMCLGIVSMTRP